MKKMYAMLLLILLASIRTGAENASPVTSPVTNITLGHSVVALTGPWKFHVGDSPQANGAKAPRWASPNFDDSAWEIVNLSAKRESLDPMMGFAGWVPGWTAKGHPGYSGFAWYRIRVRITGADEALALMGPSSLDDAYQLFANGRLIGSFGNFDRPLPTLYTNRARKFALPSGSMQSGPDGSTVLAFRFYMAPRTLLQPGAGGLHAPPVMGFSSAITAAYHVAWEDQYRAVSPILAEAIWLFAFAVLVLMLYVFDWTETILLWPLAACLLGAFTYASVFLQVTTELLTALQQSIVASVTFPIVFGLWMMTWRAYFGLQDKKWLRNIIGLLVLWEISTDVLFQVFTMGGKVSHRVFTVDANNGHVLGAVILGLSIAIAYLGWRRPHREHWILFLALFFFALPSLGFELRLLHVPTIWFPFRVPVRLPQICDLAMLFCFSFELLRRFRRSQRRQQAMEQDVKQAQEVQRVLIPEALPHVPGLTIESEYRPAREVGGDFFQILPHASDGSVLIVVGDVTGKGLQAGMLVALIVGAIRSTAQFDPDPLVMLRSLNQRLCGRGHAHATCLALRIAADGAVTLANAGHLPPYLNGKELPMEGALPLGMIESAEFSVMHFQLAPEDRLLLMSDGVVEAQDKDGQLFGFERIDAMLRKPITAAEVASAAQSFGQEDDISVLSVTRTTTIKAAIA